MSKNAVPVTLNINFDEEEKALEICDEYINSGNINIHDMGSLSIYHIISKLSEERQIEFLEDLNYTRCRNRIYLQDRNRFKEYQVI